MAGCKSATRRAQSDECATRTAEDKVIGKWEKSEQIRRRYTAWIDEQVIDNMLGTEERKKLIIMIIKK